METEKSVGGCTSEKEKLINGCRPPKKMEQKKNAVNRSFEFCFTCSVRDVEMFIYKSADPNPLRRRRDIGGEGGGVRQEPTHQLSQTNPNEDTTKARPILWYNFIRSSSTQYVGGENEKGGGDAKYKTTGEKKRGLRKKKKKKSSVSRTELN